MPFAPVSDERVSRVDVALIPVRLVWTFASPAPILGKPIDTESRSPI